MYGTLAGYGKIVTYAEKLYATEQKCGYVVSVLGG